MSPGLATTIFLAFATLLFGSIVYFFYWNMTHITTTTSESTTDPPGSFRDGTRIVGKDIAPGTYRTRVACARMLLGSTRRLQWPTG
jgi:hypothetical protein